MALRKRIACSSKPFARNNLQRFGFRRWLPARRCLNATVALVCRRKLCYKLALRKKRLARVAVLRHRLSILVGATCRYAPQRRNVGVHPRLTHSRRRSSNQGHPS